MKKMKLITTLFISLIVALSMAVSPALASTTRDGSALTTAIDGVVSESNGIGGKSTNDSYYKVSAVSSSWQTGFKGLGNGNTLECQFMLADSSSVLKVYPRYYTTAEQNTSGLSTSQNLRISATSLAYYGTNQSGTTNTQQWSKDINLTPGRWYTLVAEFCDLGADEGLQHAAFYINGSLINETKYNSKNYGYRALALGCAETDHAVYVDNIINSNSRRTGNSETHVLDIARSTPSVITSVSNGYTFADNFITAPYGAKVSNLLSAIQTTGGTNDAIKVYTDTTMTSLADNEALANGKTLVIAAKNGESTEQSYSYYNVQELDLDEEFGRGKNADDLVIHSSNSVPNSTVTSAEGNFGKKVSDDVYKVEHTTGYSIHLAPTFRDGNLTLSRTWGNLEFSFAIPSDGGVTVHAQYYNGPESTNHSYQYLHFTEGKFMTGSLGANNGISVDVDIKANKWYTVGITLNTDSSEDGKFDIYINGKYIYSVGAPNADGFRQPSLSPFANTTAYLDNISMSQTSTYNNAADTPSWIDVNGAIAANGKLSYIEKPDASDFTAASDADVRFYNSDWNEVTTVAEAEYIVTAGKDANGVERVLEYYEIDDAASDYVMGVKYDGANLVAKAYGKDANATIYLAKYSANADELISVQAVPVSEGTITAVKEDGYVYRAYVWDNSLTPYGKIVKFDYRK